MSRRKILLVLVACALALAAVASLRGPVGGLMAALTGKKSDDGKNAGDKTDEGHIRLTPEQIEASHISVAAAGPGVVERHVIVPALVVPDPDRLARVPAKVAGTVAEMRKKLGDSVKKGDVIAVVDSREVADAKSEYLAAIVNYDLQNALFQREKGLFEKKITAEQLFLKAKTVFAEAKLRLDLARQKLASLDLSEEEIAALPKQPVAELRMKEIRAPISGRVIERRANIGQPVGGGQEAELYVIADLGRVEAELSVPAQDLARIRENQPVLITAPDGETIQGVVAFISATVTPETRSGRVLASFPNPETRLRPGSQVNATVALSQSRVPVKIPRAAIQMMNGEPTVFVRTADGFAKRAVKTGFGDDLAVEIVSGLEPGEKIATSNSFLLKAELGKGDIPEE